MGGINQVKVELTSIAAMAYGSGLTEGRSGGEGHIGMIGNRAVKFNTHANEYGKNSLATLEKENVELFKQMVDSSDALRDKLRQIGNAIKEAGKGDYGNLTAVLDEVLDKENAKWSDNGVLKRKAVAKAVTEINKFLGGTANEEVWGGVENIRKSLQTRDIDDTRELFKQAAATGEADLVSEPQKGKKKEVIAKVYAKAQERIGWHHTGGAIHRPHCRGERDSHGVWQQVNDTSGKAPFEGYGFGYEDPDGHRVYSYVGKEDFQKALLYDRLVAIDAIVRGMIKIMGGECFKDCNLKDFFGYGNGAFDDIVKGLHRKSVDLGTKSCFAVDEKNYVAALRKLQDHFMKVASRQGVDNGEISNEERVAQSMARELCMKIVAFLKRQEGSTDFGEIRTLNEVNPFSKKETVGQLGVYEKEHSGSRGHDPAIDNDAWCQQIAVKLDDGDVKFWD